MVVLVGLQVCAGSYYRQTKPIEETDDVATEISSAPMFRKTMVIIGDSYVQNHKKPIEETWHYRLAEKYQMKYFNYGRNGNTIAIDRGPRGGTPIIKRYGEMHKPADYVVIVGGHNDAGEIGKDMEKLPVFREGVKKLIVALKKRYPGSKLVFVSPWNVQRAGFAEVLATLREVLPEEGVAFYDAAALSGIDPHDKEGEKAALWQGPTDTAHLTYAGHTIMLEKMEPFFLGLGLVETATPSKAEYKGPIKYRGLFINDEDWGLRPWAVKHFGKEQGIGIKAYEEIFSLMKRNGLNLMWPAMHEGGYEFVSRPENMELAAKWGIRVGTSHCEPMLRNNCYLSKDDKSKWSWKKHPQFIKNYWQWSVDRYAKNDVLWTIGMRGIHDGRMNDGDTTEEKIAILEDVFATQCAMLEKAGAGDAPKLFVPYKEVLPIFNAGLKVPEGTTIMWVNDNYGYVRRLGGPQCEGYGGGIYWHISYHGRPHGYIHTCTTPPAFMWYELVQKCANNGVRDVWMINAGDVFQAEILLYALGKFAEDPDYWMTRSDPQSEVLQSWVEERLLQGSRLTSNVPCQDIASRIVAHLNEYYNLGFIRKPEHMCIQWTAKLPEATKAELLKRYEAFLAEDIAIEEELAALATQNSELTTHNSKICDTYFRAVGFQAQFLAHAGIIHLTGKDATYAHSVIDPLTTRWDAMEGGKWSNFWNDTIGRAGDNVRQKSDGNRWSTQMQWPWNEPTNEDGSLKPRPDYVATSYKGEVEPQWIEPVNRSAANGGEWKNVPGLGTSGNAIALLPVVPGAGEGASLEYMLSSSLIPHPSSLILQFLPDYELWPEMGLGVDVQFDNAEKQYVEVPFHNSNIKEKDMNRYKAVQDNFVRVSIKIPEGAKSFRIIARNPGVVIDRAGLN